MPKPFKERRMYERYKLEFNGVINSSAEGDGAEYMYVKDVSAKGIRVTSKKRVKKDDKVQVTINLPGSESPLELTGKVIWTRSPDSNVWDIAGVELADRNQMKVRRLFHLVNPDYFGYFLLFSKVFF